MIYNNVKLEKVEKQMDWGVLSSINLGQRGRGRREICLPYNGELKVLNKGLHEDLNIGITKNGNPRINKESKRDELYLLIDSYGGYSRRGNGFILLPKSLSSEISVMAHGNGADGDAGRIGQWEVAVIKVPVDKTFTIIINPSGGHDEEFILVNEGTVYTGEVKDLLHVCDILNIVSPIKVINGKIDRSDLCLAEYYHNF